MADEPHNNTKTSDPILGLAFAGCRIIAKIGSGAMGTVYKGHHDELDKDMCVKILAPELAGDERNIQFFLREARSAAKLEHKNIVQVFNAGKEHGYHFLTMSYIDGVTLQTVIKEKGRIPVLETVQISIGILEGLAAAHAQTIIHRDIKPSNILVTRDGTPKIVDFGLARKIHEEKQLTMAGEMVGTAYYMSPEQGLGLTVDNRADLYSVGVTIFHMLTGKFPFEGKTSIEVIHKHISTEPPSLLMLMPDTPMWLADIISRLMRKKPEDRFQSAEEVIAALKEERGGLSLTPLNTGSAIKTISINIDHENAPGLSVEGLEKTTRADADEIRKSVPEMLSMEEIMEEALKSGPLAPDAANAQTVQSAAANKPPVPPSAPSARTPAAQGVIQNPVTLPQNDYKPGQAPKPRPASAVMPSKKKPGFFKTLKPMLGGLSAYAAMMTVALSVSFYMGIKMEPPSAPQAFFDQLAGPWTQAGPEQTGLLAVSLAFTVLSLVLGWQGLLSVQTLFTIGCVLAAYLGGITLNPAADLSAGAITAKIFSQFGAVNNFLVYGVLAFLAGGLCLSAENRSAKQKISGTILALLSLYFIGRFSFLQAATNGENAFLMIAVTSALAAISIGAMNKNSQIASISTWGLLLLSLASVWAYGTSGKADMYRSMIEAHQENAIQSALRQKEMLEFQPQEQNKVVVPQRKTLEEITKEARKKAGMEPLYKFTALAAEKASYLMSALLLFLLCVFLHIRYNFASRRSSSDYD
ncbi:MAG: protein kinase [Elusimicrobiaceae bacterium]